MDDKQRLLVALALGLGDDHEFRSGLGSDVLDGIMSLAEIGKDELLDGFDIGDKPMNLFESGEVWNKFGDIIKMFAEAGTPVTPEDLFLERRSNGKRLVEMAIANKQVDKLFEPEIWRGRIADMEEAFYSIEKSERSGIDFVDAKRQVAALDGETIREDELKAMGIEPNEVVQAIKGGTLGTIKTKLDEHGGQFKLEDMLFVDSDGDNAFYAATAFNQGHFGSMMNFLEEAGIQPDASFYLRKLGDRSSVLENVLKHDGLAQVFTKKYWAGRPQEMMTIYDNVPASKREKFEIVPVLKQVLDGIYAERFNENVDVSLEELTEAVDIIEFKNDAGQADTYPIVMLGFPSTWEKIDEIVAHLESRGEFLTTDHLKMECGIPKRNIFSMATEAGKFDLAFDIIKREGTLSADLLLQQNEGGKTTLDHIIAQGKLPELFDEQLWAGKTADMEEIYSALPDNQKSNITQMLSAVNIRTLRAEFSKGGDDGLADRELKGPGGIKYMP